MEVFIMVVTVAVIGGIGIFVMIRDGAKVQEEQEHKKREQDQYKQTAKSRREIADKSHIVLPERLADMMIEKIMLRTKLKAKLGYYEDNLSQDYFKKELIYSYPTDILKEASLIARKRLMDKGYEVDYSDTTLIIRW